MNIECLPVNLDPNLRALYVSMHTTILTMHEEINRLKRQLFGAKSERHNLGDPILPIDNLFNEAEVLTDFVGPPAPLDLHPNTGNEKRRKRSLKSGGRKKLPDNLPRDQVIHDVDECDKKCPNDGTVLTVIGEEKSETLEYSPGQLRIIETIRLKYGCKTCKCHVEKAKAIPTILPQSQCGASLAAQIIISKYFLALPLYRQEKMYSQMGVDISRTSMARWVIKTNQFLTPLLDLLKEFILSREVIHADETFFQVLKEVEKAPQSKSYMWTICTSKSDPAAVYYEYHDNRSGKSAKNLLQDFNGLLHVDKYAGYNSIVKNPKVTRIGCWAHGRRYFDVAKKDGAEGGKTIAAEFLTRIQELFALERKWQGLSIDEILSSRQQIAAPLVENIRALLDKYRSQVSPKSHLGKAIAYLDNDWPIFTVYLSDGRAAISNNRMENFIRPFAIGRKNWLFSDTPAGAHASAGLYSLLITAQENKLDVRAYLVAIFTELPILFAKNPKPDLTPYLPWNWKAAQAQKTVVPSAPA